MWLPHNPFSFHTTPEDITPTNKETVFGAVEWDMLIPRKKGRSENQQASKTVDCIFRGSYKVKFIYLFRPKTIHIFLHDGWSSC